MMEIVAIPIAGHLSPKQVCKVMRQQKCSVADGTNKKTIKGVWQRD
jgi:hypothetical protein